MKNLAIFIVCILLVFLGFGFSTNTALAGDGESNDVLLDVNQAP